MQAINLPTKWWIHKRLIARDIDRFLRSAREHCGTGLHLGAGGNRVEGLINCDLHNPEADRRIDCMDLGEFGDGSVGLIETHHMIEHLSFEECDRALREWHRVLRPGGLLILTCPDISRVCFKWLKTSCFRWFRRSADDEMDYIVKMFVGSQENAGMFHKNAFDGRRLTRTLVRHGFRVLFTYSPFPIRPTPSLIVIACKPADRT